LSTSTEQGRIHWRIAPASHSAPGVFRWLPTLAVVLLAAGCSEVEEPTGPVRFPVLGQLLIDGQPAAGATIKFIPADGKLQARSVTAQVRADGHFAASYLSNEDGIPAGTYDLVVYWLDVPPEGGLPVDRLQGRFCNPQQPVSTITVIEGENQLEAIELSTEGLEPSER